MKFVSIKAAIVAASVLFFCQGAQATPLVNVSVLGSKDGLSYSSSLTGLNPGDQNLLRSCRSTCPHQHG